MEVMKNACRRKWQQILLEMEFLGPKNSKDESFWDLKLFKNQENYLQNGVWEIIFKIRKGVQEMACGSKVAMHKAHHAKTPSPRPRVERQHYRD